MIPSKAFPRLQLWPAERALIAPEALLKNVGRYAVILALCGVLAGCGGRGLVSSGTSTSTPAPSPAPVTTSSNPGSNAPGAGSGSTTPTPVAVSAGASVTAVNITVAPAASSQPPNVEDLGVNPASGLGMAANTGDAIHRGSTMRVLLFGPGLNSAMQVSIAGPHDIAVTNLQSVQATDNTPGVAFTAAVSANAALGARTVFLKNSNGDVTSFTGGLEVIP